MKTTIAIVVVLLLACTGCAHRGHKSALVPEPETASATTAPSAGATSPAAQGATADIIARSETESLAADAQTDPFADEESDPFADDDLDFLEDEEEAAVATVADPLEPLNRFFFVVNDKLYFWLLKPLAIVYNSVTPQQGRIWVRNFFDNLKMPVRVVNSLLQDKPEQAGNEMTRFMFNSTFGILGFGNPAAKYAELKTDSEDFGQTLATYGVGDGFYLYLPLLGPSTLRDAAGMVGGIYLSPTTYLEPASTRYGVSAYERFNAIALRIGDYETLKAAAIDPYQAFRDGYIQYRRAQISK